MSEKKYDAIVVGSGATGGFAAKELTERGLEVVVLEAGPISRKRSSIRNHTPRGQIRWCVFVEL